MTSKEKHNENLYEWISGIFGQISNGYPLQCSETKLQIIWYNQKMVRIIFIKKSENYKKVIKKF
jgi:hypothetical protein